MAGLPASKPCVRVGPPKKPNGDSRGSNNEPIVPDWLPEPLSVIFASSAPKRLLSPSIVIGPATDRYTSGSDAWLLPAMIVLLNVTVALLLAITMPPPPPAAVLFVIVQLLIV